MEKHIIKVPWYVKWGYRFLLMSWVAVLFLFFKAFTHPSKTVIVSINNYYEAVIELVLLGLSLILVPMFVYFLHKNDIIKLRLLRRFNK